MRATRREGKNRISKLQTCRQWYRVCYRLRSCSNCQSSFWLRSRCHCFSYRNSHCWSRHCPNPDKLKSCLRNWSIQQPQLRILDLSFWDWGWCLHSSRLQMNPRQTTKSLWRCIHLCTLPFPQTHVSLPKTNSKNASISILIRYQNLSGTSFLKLKLRLRIETQLWLMSPK